MNLTEQQIGEYQDQGALLVKGLLTGNEVATITKEIEYMDQSSNTPGFSFDDENFLRSFFNPEQYSICANRLIKSDRVRNCVRPLLNEPYYLYQSKFNTKRALKSGTWKWHSDYWFWKYGDRMPMPKAITMAIFLDDVKAASGPILYVPGSHKTLQEPTMDKQGDDHAENLKYYLDASSLRKIVEKFGNVEMAVGNRGDAFLFHCNLMHASNQNMYFLDRKILMLTFNPVSNKIGDFRSSRTDYMVKVDFDPVG